MNTIIHDKQFLTDGFTATLEQIFDSNIDEYDDCSRWDFVCEIIKANELEIGQSMIMGNVTVKRIS